MCHGMELESRKSNVHEFSRVFPGQRGNVRHSGIHVPDAILHAAENGCSRRRLPARFGKWHAIHARMRRMTENGVIKAAFDEFRKQEEIHIEMEILLPDSTAVKVHPGARKAEPQTIGRSLGWPTTMVHGIAASDGVPVLFSLAPGQRGDAPEGRIPIKQIDVRTEGVDPVTDRACEGDDTRNPVREKGLDPVAPPGRNRRNSREFDREKYKRRNEIECLFRRMKGWRRVFTRHDELDAACTGVHPLRPHPGGSAIAPTDPGSLECSGNHPHAPSVRARRAMGAPVNIHPLLLDFAHPGLPHRNRRSVALKSSLDNAVNEAGFRDPEAAPDQTGILKIPSMMLHSDAQGPKAASPG